MRTGSSGGHSERSAIAVVAVAVTVAIAVGSEELVDLLWARRSKI